MRAKKTARTRTGLVRALASALTVAVAASTAALPAAAETRAATNGARYHGSVAGTSLKAPIVGLASSATGNGYWLVASDGGIFAFGDARFRGSTGAMRLNAAIVGMAATPSGNGYWLVASDGGIFAFGDARFRGSTGALRLNAAIVGMAATPSGNGYWLVASDGGIFAFGDAEFRGSTGGRRLASPIVGIAADPLGDGYRMLARDGGVFAFGRAQFLGAATGLSVTRQMVAMAAPAQGGYWLVTADGAVFAARADGGFDIDPNLAHAPPEQQIIDDLYIRVNAERRARGLPDLAWDPVLASLAGGWAASMAVRNTFGHQDLAGTLGSQPFQARYQALRENIYSGNGSFRDSGSAHVSLMRSDSHRSTILARELQSIGIGVACAAGRLWVTQDFGTWASNPAPGGSTSAPDPLVRGDEAGPSCP